MRGRHVAGLVALGFLVLGVLSLLAKLVHWGLLP